MMTATDLRNAVWALLLERATALLEYSPARYENDVVDAAVYAGRPTAAWEFAAQAEHYAAAEAQYDAEYDEHATEVSAAINAVALKLRANYLARAPRKLKAMSWQVDRATRDELRAIVKEHRSEDATLFAYLTMRSVIEWELEQSPVADGTLEDRFGDEESEYDGPEQLGALLRDLSLPKPADVARAKARATKRAAWFTSALVAYLGVGHQRPLNLLVHQPMVTATLDPKVIQQIVAFSPNAEAWAKSATDDQLTRMQARVDALVENIDDRVVLMPLAWIRLTLTAEQSARALAARRAQRA